MTAKQIYCRSVTAKLAVRRWRLQHPDKVKEINKRYLANMDDEARARKKEQGRTACKRYHETHREIINARERKRKEGHYRPMPESVKKRLKEISKTEEGKQKAREANKRWRLLNPDKVRENARREWTRMSDETRSKKREYNKQWQLNHRKQTNAKQRIRYKYDKEHGLLRTIRYKKYRLNNKEKCASYQRSYFIKNKDRVLNRIHTYKTNHPLLIKKQSLVKRAKKQGLTVIQYLRTKRIRTNPRQIMSAANIIRTYASTN